jgi:hypothetical protein
MGYRVVYVAVDVHDVMDGNYIQSIAKTAKDRVEDHLNENLYEYGDRFSFNKLPEQVDAFSGVHSGIAENYIRPLEDVKDIVASAIEDGDFFNITTLDHEGLPDNIYDYFVVAVSLH